MSLKDDMQDLQAQVIAALRTKAPMGFRCEVCGQQNWAVQKGLYWFTEHHKSEMYGIVSTGYGPALPSACVVCQTCGNTKFFNTQVLVPNFQEYR